MGAGGAGVRKVWSSLPQFMQQPRAAWPLELHGHPSSAHGRLLHPATLPLPLLSLLPPEEVQLEGDRALSSAGADRTKVNMPAIAAASGLWTDDGCWAGEDHTHEAPWTTQAPACPAACLRHTLARRGAEAYIGCLHLSTGSHSPVDAGRRTSKMLCDFQTPQRSRG